MKHAYLVIAHSNFQVLEVLVEMLDYPDNDIYVHIDRKVKYKIKYSPQSSNLFVVPDEKRVDVRWGDCSQIWSELVLYRMAYTHGGYRYYHLMSGQNLPIKSNVYIHKFFEERDGKEFIGIMHNAWRSKTKTMYYHVLTRNLKSCTLKAKIQRMIHWSCTQVQKCLPVVRSRTGMKTLTKGCTYSSLTNEAVDLVLSKEAWIRKRFRWTFASDEIYKHTIIMQSSLGQNLYRTDDEYEGCMLLQDWKRWNGESYVWTMDEWDEIMESNKLFARKFSDLHIDIVLRLKEKLKMQDAL